MLRSGVFVEGSTIAVKIYTKLGDDGLTGLIAPGRHFKCSPRIEAYGTVDELNAALGVARAFLRNPPIDEILSRVQNELFTLGSALADPAPDGPYHGALTFDAVLCIERDIDQLESTLPPLQQFILPGGTTAAAQIHLARTICRRAERRVISLRQEHGEHVPDAIVAYLNRLGDMLFVVARCINRDAGLSDVPWAGID